MGRVPRRKAPTSSSWRAAVVAGGGLLLIGTGGVAWAEQHVDSGVVALVVAVMPLWLALLDRQAALAASR